VHIFPHWNWPGREGQPIHVGCYSNCDEVELILNEQSLGRKTMLPHSHLEWEDVAYVPGILEARGYRNNELAATHRVETSGAAHAVRMQADFVQYQPGGVAVIRVAIVDAAGQVVPVADHLVSFHLEGPARIIGVGNGNPSSHEADLAVHRRAFNGLCQVILLLQRTDDPINLYANSAGLQTGHLSIAVAITGGLDA
jgi:beta-galactosidase